VVSNVWAAMEEAELMESVRVAWRHMFLNLIVLVAPFQSRLLYVKKLAGNDNAKATAWMSYMSAAAGIMEFCLNPICGRLSDRYGRKVFILLSPLANALLKMLVFLTDGSSLPIVVLERCLGGALTTVGGSTTCAASISDVLEGAELSGALGNLGSYAGRGVVAGPFIAGQILALTGKVKYTYLFGATVAALQFCYNASRFQETLQKVKPMNWSACNPLSFVQVFTKNSTLSRLTLVAGLQCFPEGKSLSDLNMSHIAYNLNFTARMQTIFVMLFGSSMILAGKLPQLLIPQHLSQRNFTSLSNYFTVVALTIWATSKSHALYWLGLALLCPSMERRTATSAMATDHAVAAGFGKGEFAGNFANWRALCVACAPLLYGTIAQKFPRPGSAYFAAAAITLGTELLFRSIPPEKLAIKGE